MGVYLKKCCFVVSVHTGSYVISLWNLASAFFGIISWATLSGSLTMSLLELREENSSDEMPSIFLFKYILIGTGIFCCLCRIIMTIILSRGLKKNKCYLVRCYLMFGPPVIFLNLVLAGLYSLYIAFYIGLGSVVGVFMEVYFLLVILSAYKQMVEQGKRGPVAASHESTAALPSIHI